MHNDDDDNDGLRLALCSCGWLGGWLNVYCMEWLAVGLPGGFRVCKHTPGSIRVSDVVLCAHTIRVCVCVCCAWCIYGKFDMVSGVRVSGTFGGGIF